MLSVMHRVSGAIAALTIASFWLSTLISELFLTQSAIVTVKTLIPYGFLLLIPAMAAVGATGFRLAKGRSAGLIGAKRKRMPFVAANGVLVLIPAALFLSWKSQAGAFDAAFYAVQGLELLAGATNLTLLGLNLRDGRRLTAPRRRAASKA
ncbi:hypothetical protein [Rhodobacter ferrooxidans]|uniref:Uncharacterized protein n=1 Tax=Rhodobacter ferrooxidans TaxID=371731 RepID=C8S2H7_9RHOB|nr:hypothetical protein [Rhodobacter sp. SW2]EEW24848.1 conserved hypothetical protein [Rhodobacter sp. SW2]